MTSIPGWKKENPWLAESDTMALQQAARNDRRAWKNHFGNPRHFSRPRFRNKREHRASYRTNGNGGAVRIVAPERGKNGKVRLPKVGEARTKASRVHAKAAADRRDALHKARPRSSARTKRSPWRA